MNVMPQPFFACHNDIMHLSSPSSFPPHPIASLAYRSSDRSFPLKILKFVLKSARTGYKKAFETFRTRNNFAGLSESRCQKQYLITPFQYILPPAIAEYTIQDMFKEDSAFFVRVVICKGHNDEVWLEM